MSALNIDKRLQDIHDFFENPENSKIIEENKAFSKEVTAYVNTKQNELMQELNKDNIFANPPFTI